MENKCKIVQDLLPTYIEDLTSEETTIFIKDHLEHCQNCNNIYINMKSDIEKENIKNTEIVQDIKKYKKRIILIKLTFILVISAILIYIIGTLSFRFYVVRKVYDRNTNYKSFEGFTIEEYESNIEYKEKHYTTYFKNDIMKKYYGDDLIEYYKNGKHYFFNNENHTYYVKEENVNTNLNINISILNGMENIIKDNKISNLEILKFITCTKGLKINTRYFTEQKYYQLYCDGQTILFDMDTFFATRIEKQDEKYVYQEPTEYRVTINNVGWRLVQEPDFSKYTLIEK